MPNLLKLGIALALGPFVASCGDPGVGAAPVVQVTPEQHATEANAKAEATAKWLEGMTDDARQKAARTPQVVEALKGANDPALKTRIASLGIPNLKP